MEMEINPYAAPQSKTLQASNQDEVIRQEHIYTEATIKSVGMLYYLGTFILLIFALISFTTSSIEVTLRGPLLGTVILVLAVGQGVTAYGLRRLQNWARIPTIIFSCIGLLVFPLGTLINVYILTKVLGKQGRFVMTPEYQRIIAATPHVKRKSSILALLLLALLIISLIAVIAGVIMSKN